MNSNTASSFWTFIPNLYFIFLYFCAYIQYIANIPCYMLPQYTIILQISIIYLLPD